MLTGSWRMGTDLSLGLRGLMLRGSHFFCVELAFLRYATQHHSQLVLVQTYVKARRGSQKLAWEPRYL